MSQKKFFVLALLLLLIPIAGLAMILPTLKWSATSNFSSGSAQEEATYGEIDSQYLYAIGYVQDGSYHRTQIEKHALSDGALVYATRTDSVAYYISMRKGAIDASYMYLAGYDNETADYKGRIEKRNLSDGALVYATTSNPSAGVDTFTNIAIDSQYMYVVGVDAAPGNNQWRIEKRNLSDGALVYATTSNPSANNDQPSAIVVDSSYMYVGGRDSQLGAGDIQWRIEKRNLSDGALVYEITTNPSAGNLLDLIYSLVADSSYLYICGADRSPGHIQARIEKRNLSDGALVYATTSDPSSAGAACHSIRVNSSYMYLGGYDYVPGATNSQWRIEKRDLYDGSLVYATTSDFTVGYDIINALALSSSTMYALGREGNDTGVYGYTTGERWRLEAYDILSTPTITSFSPTTLQAESGATTLTINGTNFSASTTAVTWDGDSRTATFVTSTQMTLALSDNDVFEEGIFTLVVPNDDPTGSSGSATYEITSAPKRPRSSGYRVPTSVAVPSQSTSVPVFQFLKNLKYLQEDFDVKKLQEFLNAHGFMVSQSGPGSLGNETTFFGAKTLQALIKFQEANAAAILVPNGLLKGTGFFGPSTRGVVNGVLSQ